MTNNIGRWAAQMRNGRSECTVFHGSMYVSKCYVLYAVNEM